jgi:putative transposase
MYNVYYYIVFTTKYRKKVLTESVEKVLREEIAIIAKSKELNLCVSIGDFDQLYLLVSAKPTATPSNLVKVIKGVTAKKLFERCPELRDELPEGNLWNPSYYFQTIGSISEEDIARYLEKQPKQKNHL